MKLWPSDGLWRHPDFLKLWSAETVSQFGTQISQLALPLAAIAERSASAFEVAALATVEFLPFLLVSLPAGVWVDRLPRRPILVIGDLARAGLLLSLPIAYWLDALTIWQMYAVGFFVGIAISRSRRPSGVKRRALVDRRQIVDGNAKLEVSRTSAQFGGPGFAGLLIGWLKAPVAILLDVISFLFSALFIFAIRKYERPRADREPRRRMRTELREGLSYVLRHPYLKNIAACTALFNFFGSMTFAIVLVFARRELGLSAEAIGLAMTLGNIGGILAAVTSTRLSARFGVGNTIIATAIVGGPMFLAIPFAPHGHAALLVIVPAWIVGAFSGVAYNVAQISLRQAITPERIQGRMNSVMRFIVWGTIPLGTLAGGALATWIGLRETIVVGAIGGGLAVLWIVFSPQRHLRGMPEPIEDEAATETGFEEAVPSLSA